MECLFCGSTFEPIMKNQKYCSAFCQRKASYVKKKSAIPKREPIIYHKQCAFCNKDFDSNYTQQLFCCKQCAQKSAYLRNKSRLDADYLSEEKSIDQVRALYNLTPIKKGNIACLSCGNDFYSEDLVREQLCLACKQKASGGSFQDYIGYGVRRNGRYFIPTESI